ncbi:hypothetical protein [Usitatibacter palustris]|uniref:hypothetical protein n=1 Tax=Usitatibacter palustris TaxID=2732487 RepID=UPI00148868B3|nr:hypothetical protein [Usitatibacter palustris]
MLTGLEYSIAVGPGQIGDIDAALLTLSSEFVELNVWLPLQELDRLESRIPLDQGGTKAFQAGRSAGAPVHWIRQPTGQLYILVGDDDETWDFSIIVSPSCAASLFTDLRMFAGREKHDA